MGVKDFWRFALGAKRIQVKHLNVVIINQQQNMLI